MTWKPEPDALEPDKPEPDALEPDKPEPDALEPDKSEPDALEPDASESETPEPNPEPIVLEPEPEMIDLKPSLDMRVVSEDIVAGRTPTCPDCGEALTRVFSEGALVPADYVPPRPEDHRCDPRRLAELRWARTKVGAPGETRADRASASPVVEEASVVVDAPPRGDEEDV
jgi:hypothetical protein